MRYSSLSEQGRRPNNEDVVFTRFDPRYPLIAAVSDGMGGHAAGEVASEIAIRTMEDLAPRTPDTEALCHAVTTANLAVIDAAVIIEESVFVERRHGFRNLNNSES